jgi:membrane dipeptidase
MGRFLFLATVALTLISCSDGGPSAPEEVDARTLHDRIITFDAEMDYPPDFMEGTKDAGKETLLQIDLPKMDRGGLDGALFVVWMVTEKRDEAGYAEAIARAENQMAAFEKMIATYPEHIGLARSADEAEALVAAGKHFAVAGMVNAYPLGSDLSRLGAWYDRGLRNITLTHVGHNQFADSSRPQREVNEPPEEHGGLSDLGRKLIAEMNRLGIIVDVSQVTRKVVMEVTQLSTVPVIASHSGVKAIVDTARNLTDEEMIAIKNTGGLVGIVAFSSYLKRGDPERRPALAKIEEIYGTTTLADVMINTPDKVEQFKADMAAHEKRFPRANVGHLVDSIDYAVQLIGIDHVTISSDMEHGGGVTGWMNAGEAFAVTEELVRRGYSEADITQLWWGNFARVWRAVQAAAGS